ncbi:unnamed protein product [Brassica oleracea]
MKPMFYFLVALTVVLAATANAGEPVLDSDGDIITNGSYYVLPAIAGAIGGGLNLSADPWLKCPHYIGQEDSTVNRGFPVKFSNWQSKVGFVPESERLNIEMDGKATICVQPTYWGAIGDDPWLHSLSIKVGPKPGAGKDSINAFFQIKKTEDVGVYNIASCPVGNTCETVGLLVGGGVRRLVARFAYAKPFPVRLVKATGTSYFVQDYVYYLREIKDYKLKRVITYD